MIALATGFFLVGYLLGPGAIYRLVFAVVIPSKRFQRTRTEEVVFSIIVTAVPFIVAWALLFHSPLGRFPHFSAPVDKITAYKRVFSGLLGDSSRNLLSEYICVLKQQCRFLFYLWLFCGIEAYLAARLVSRYGTYEESSTRRTICDKFLLRHVSEWELLFSTLPIDSARANYVVEVDVLCNPSTLYRGRLDNWFVDVDGKLSGLFLINAERYMRDELHRDREKGLIKDRSAYWRTIPGENLYITASSVLNYNVRYVEATTAQIVQEELGNEVIVTPLPGPSEPPSSINPA